VSAAAHHSRPTWPRSLLLAHSASGRHTRRVNVGRVGSASPSESRPDTEVQSWSASSAQPCEDVAPAASGSSRVHRGMPQEVEQRT